MAARRLCKETELVLVYLMQLHELKTGVLNQYSGNLEWINQYFLVVHVLLYNTFQLAVQYEKGSVVSDLTVMTRSSFLG